MFDQPSAVDTSDLIVFLSVYSCLDDSSARKISLAQNIIPKLVPLQTLMGMGDLPSNSVKSNEDFV